MKNNTMEATANAKIKSSFLSRFNARYVRHYNLYSWGLLRHNQRADFMNLGFIADNFPPFSLTDTDSKSKNSIALYTKVLEGADFAKVNTALEVASGLGGGCYLLKNYYKVPNVSGVDYAKYNVAYSNKKFNDIGLFFEQYSADHINQLNKKYDLILCVEASQHFEDWDTFIKNISLLLSDTGVFCYADMFIEKDKQIIESIIKKYNLVIERAEDIAPGVTKSMALMQPPPKKSLRYKIMCAILGLNSLEEYEAYKGSKLYNMMDTGEIKYMKYLIRKSVA